MTHVPGTFGPFVIKSIAGYSNLSVILFLSLSLTLLKLLLLLFLMIQFSALCFDAV